MFKGAKERQKEIYIKGLSGLKPSLSTDYNGLERTAQKRLSKEAFAYIAGGAGLESTVENNRSVWNYFQLVPRMLQGHSSPDLSVKILNQSFEVPFFLCPIGVLELAHPQGDLAVAEACQEMKVPMMVSNQASHSMEVIAKKLNGGPWYFQLYVSKSDELVESLVRRAENADAKGIIITLDTTLLGWRNRDLNLAYLPFLHGKGIAQYTSDPVFQKIAKEWPDQKSDAKINLTTLKNLFGLSRKLPGSTIQNLKGDGLKNVRAFTQLYTRPDLDWATINKIKTATKLPVILKGIQHEADAALAIENGIDAIYVSNHGGRQVDGAISSLEAMVAIKKAVGNKIPILMDSGIRCGSDVIKAIALGATAVGIGRPYAYALAINGKNGIVELIKNLLAEIEINLSLCGVSSLKECHQIKMHHSKDLQ